MSVEIKEVVSTVKVKARSANPYTDEMIASVIDTAVVAVEERMARNERRAAATEIADDGRGHVARQGWGARV